MQELPPLYEQDSSLLSTGTWLVMIVLVLALICTLIVLSYIL